MENRIRGLRRPLDSNDVVNKRYLSRPIEFMTKELENKLTALETKMVEFST